MGRVDGRMKDPTLRADLIRFLERIMLRFDPQTEMHEWALNLKARVRREMKP
jgi:hypothetical protein